MPRKRQRQEQTGGAINPQMQFIQEQQFISQEKPEQVGRPTSQYKTIFGKDDPTAFKRQSTGIENLMNIVRGSVNIIDSAGKTSHG